MNCQNFVTEGGIVLMFKPEDDILRVIEGSVKYLGGYYGQGWYLISDQVKCALVVVDILKPFLYERVSSSSVELRAAKFLERYFLGFEG